AVVAIGLTESRGGAIALGVVVVLGLLLLPGARRWIVAAVGVGAVALAASPGVLARTTSLDGDGTGRDDLWRVATQMTLDHPWGVGLNNFRSESAAYALDPGAIEHLSQIVGRPVVVHNTYLQLAAELGVVGLLLFLGVVVAAVAAAWRAATVFAATGRPGLATLARSAVVAQASFLVAALFVSFGFSYRMWSLMALGPALLTAARQPRSTRP
ncbi:MAG: O-antigen polymerase, partial [Solirubrobacterales bacterium]|nr:O-antigen polymerase [Solirubrobacterales bacterium]